MENIGQNILASSIVLLAFLIICFLIYTILGRRNVAKKKSYYEDIHKRLAKGQRVMFSDGLYGKLLRVGMETCDIEVKSGAVIEVSRYAIQEIVDK